MLHAYCVRRAGDPAPPPGLTGLGGAAVRLVEEAGVGFWLSPAPDGPATVERVREHDAVVRRALRSATPLPVRYGAARFPDEDAARQALRAARTDFLAALDRLAGRVEMGVRVAWRTPPPSPPPAAQGGAIRSGRDYLEARRRAFAAEAEHRRRAEAELDRVAAAFAGLDLETARAVGAETEVAGTLAHLVHVRDLPAYRALAEAARAAVPELDLAVTGPWAPYSFV